MNDKSIDALLSIEGPIALTIGSFLASIITKDLTGSFAISIGIWCCWIFLKSKASRYRRTQGGL